MMNSRLKIFLAFFLLLWAPSSPAISWPKKPTSWTMSSVKESLKNAWNNDKKAPRDLDNSQESQNPDTKSSSNVEKIKAQFLIYWKKIIEKASKGVLFISDKAQKLLAQAKAKAEEFRQKKPVPPSTKADDDEFEDDDDETTENAEKSLNPENTTTEPSRPQLTPVNPETESTQRKTEEESEEDEEEGDEETEDIPSANSKPEINKIYQKPIAFLAVVYKKIRDFLSKKSIKQTQSVEENNQPQATVKPETTEKPESFWDANKRNRAELAEQQRKNAVALSKADRYGTFGFEELDLATALKGDPLETLEKPLDPAEYFKNRTKIKTEPDKKIAVNNFDVDVAIAREGGVASTAKSRMFSCILGLVEEDLTLNSLLLNGGLPFLLTALTGPINSGCQWITNSTPDEVKIYKNRMQFDNYIKEYPTALKSLYHVSPDNPFSGSYYNPEGSPFYNESFEKRRLEQPPLAADIVERNKKESRGKKLNLINSYKNPLLFAACYLAGQCRAHNGIENGLRKALIEEPLALPVVGGALAGKLVLYKTINFIFSLLPKTIPAPRVGQINLSFINFLTQAGIYILLINKLYNGIFSHSVNLLTQVKKELAENLNATGLKVSNNIPHEMRGYKYLVLDSNTHKTGTMVISGHTLINTVFFNLINTSENMPDAEKNILKIVSSYMWMLSSGFFTFINALTPRTYILTSDLAYLAPKTREALLQQAHSERVLKTMLWAGIAGSATHLSKQPLSFCSKKIKVLINNLLQDSAIHEANLKTIAQKLDIDTPKGIANLRGLYEKTKSTMPAQERLKQIYVQQFLSSKTSSSQLATTRLASFAQFNPLNDTTQGCQTAIEAAIEECDRTALPSS